VTNGTNERRTVRRWLPILLILWISAPWCHVRGAFSADSSAEPSDDSKTLWETLIAQADSIGLPTRFVKTIQPGFVTLEFDDLHAFAAEYHPDQHRMVLNRTFSFNAAGGVLESLTKLPPRELGTLYHELFHAYMDYITTVPTPSDADSRAAELYAFAKDRQECRYRQVKITPILQRKSHTETRWLTDRESWEALNETWAVFVGWAVWTSLEGQGTGSQKRGEARQRVREGWMKRLKKADRDADLLGYYEPEDTVERGMARKRYLAPPNRITPREVGILLEQVLEYSDELARRSTRVMEQNRPSLPGSPPCQR
jgi:hypothetical protein